MKSGYLSRDARTFRDFFFYSQDLPEIRRLRCLCERAHECECARIRVHMRVRKVGKVGDKDGDEEGEEYKRCGEERERAGGIKRGNGAGRRRRHKRRGGGGGR